MLFLSLLTALYGCAHVFNEPNALISEIESGNAEQVNKLLTKSNINAESHGQTPLRIAVRLNKKEMAELLIAKGADVNTKDHSGYTPLHEAVMQGNRSVVELLIANGADVNARKFSFDTPLHLAARFGDKEIAELLVENGALVNSRGIYGSPLVLAVTFENKSMAELLIAKGADVNTKDYYGRTPLHLATKNGNKEMIELLIAHGGDVNAKDQYQSTPLHFANEWGNKDIAEILVSNGADANIKNILGKSPASVTTKQNEIPAAAIQGLYGYLGYGMATYSEAPKDSATGLRFGAGYRFNRYLGVEVGSSDSDVSSGSCNFCNFVGSIGGGYQSWSFSSSTSYFAVVGTFSIHERAEAFGKLGQATTSLSYSLTTTPCLLGLCGQPQTVSSSASQKNTMNGFGLQWRSELSHFYYRLQYENFGIVRMSIPRHNQPAKIANIGINVISFNILCIF